MNLDQAVAYLDSHLNLERTGGRTAEAALDSMLRLMRALGEPQLDVPVIQVTGTNGKGSTATMITRLLGELGLAVGTYTSPHLTSITERIQRNGEAIESDDLAATIGRLALAEKSLDTPPSWFELMTAAAYLWFADTAVDIAVVEVGKRGRFDATSVVAPQVAVVTNVTFDHTDGAGDWRRDLALEQAGIIHSGTVLCLGETDPEVEEVFAAAGAAQVLRRGDDFDCEDNVLAVGGRMVDLRTPQSHLREVFLSAHGAHQGDNAAIALAATEAFLDTPVGAEVVAAALGEVHLPGRFEVVAVAPIIIVDGAHNPAGAQAAADTLNEAFDAPQRCLILGMLEGHDPRWMLELFEAERADLVIACTAPSPRAIPAVEIATAARALGVAVETIADPAEALDRALTVSTEHDLIFASGSMLVAGAVRDALIVQQDLQ